MGAGLALIRAFDTLARRASLDRSTVKRHLRLAADWLDQDRGGGRGRATRYRAKIPAQTVRELNGGMAERLAGAGGTVQWTNYIAAGGTLAAMRVEHALSGAFTRYFHTDHLGSIATITDEAGAVVQRLSYDAD